MASTFLVLKTKVQNRLKLTSPDSATRIGQFLNERYRAVATSCGLTAVRFGTVTLTTVAGTVDYNPSTLVHPITVTYPGGNYVLDEQTVDFFRNLDPAGTRTGRPELWAVRGVTNAGTTMTIFPIPDGPPNYTLTIDGILAGTDLAADGDVPVLPEDFLDVLVFGATADELTKLEKSGLADKLEAKYEKRLSELRYFIAKTAYLTTRQNDNDYWWWGPWFHSYKGFS